MSTVHKLRDRPNLANPVFDLADLSVGSVLEFHGRAGTVIVRKVVALFRNYRLERKGSVEREGDVLQFDDGYLVGAGYCWRSVQWRIVN